MRKLDVVDVERYARTDTSVTSQVVKLMAANPDAVLVAASGTPAVLPAFALRERGYKGQIYFTDGVINNDFLRVGGKTLEGAFLPAGPVGRRETCRTPTRSRRSRSTSAGATRRRTARAR